MVAPSVEQLKRQYTDKYVKVDAARPELARFRDVVGQVKTVNMSGRALVEFLDYHLNIGWFDIDLSCLTVVDKPEAKAAADAAPKRAHDKPPGKAAPTTGEKQTADAAKPERAGTIAGGSTAKPAAGKKMSVAEMLAAARAGDAAKGAASAEPKAKEAPAAKPAAAAPKAKGKMSVAEMLAAARAADSGGGAKETPEAKAPAEEAPAAAEEAAPPKPAAEAAAPAKAATGETKRVDRSKMSVAEMIAYCREHDAK
jgi:hypothetical protein